MWFGLAEGVDYRHASTASDFLYGQVFTEEIEPDLWSDYQNLGANSLPAELATLLGNTTTGCITLYAPDTVRDSQACLNIVDSLLRTTQYGLEPTSQGAIQLAEWISAQNWDDETPLDCKYQVILSQPLKSEALDPTLDPEIHLLLAILWEYQYMADPSRDNPWRFKSLLLFQLDNVDKDNFDTLGNLAVQEQAWLETLPKSVTY